MLVPSAPHALNVIAPVRHHLSPLARAMNVLLVDDEALARRRLRRLLSDAPDVTVVAESGSGSAAIEALKMHRVDVVFCDIQMPGVDGFVVAQSLQGPEA